MTQAIKYYCRSNKWRKSISEIEASYEEDSMEDDTTKIGVAILIGGMIGAALALLYAPKSGRETRKEIIRAARRGKNRTVDLIEDTIDEVNDLVTDLKKKALDIVDQGVDLTDKTKKEIVTALEQGQKAIEKQRQKFTEALGL
jgi:gas vesicle protein